MEEYTNSLKEYLGKNRKWGKNIFKIIGTIYRGVTKGRITFDEGFQAIYKLGSNLKSI